VCSRWHPGYTEVWQVGSAERGLWTYASQFRPLPGPVENSIKCHTWDRSGSELQRPSESGIGAVLDALRIKFPSRPEVAHGSRARGQDVPAALADHADQYLLALDACEDCRYRRCGYWKA